MSSTVDRIVPSAMLLANPIAYATWLAYSADLNVRVRTHYLEGEVVQESPPLTHLVPVPNCVWEGGEAGDQRPTFYQAMLAFEATCKGMAAATGVPREVISKIRNCHLVPTYFQCIQLAAWFNRLPDQIRWPRKRVAAPLAEGALTEVDMDPSQAGAA